MKLKTIQIQICQPCLDGEGAECHTPGCALWLHRVDLPIDPLVYDTLSEVDIGEDGLIVPDSQINHLAPDVSRLVLAARRVAFEDQGRDSIKELDDASEAFAHKLPWDNEPTTLSNGGAIDHER